ncbi:MAG: tetratricopeptide repeat protein [Bacteroidota bacterium]
MKDHKLAAIVFTDIVGYTKRMEIDEEGTMKLLARQRELVFPLVKKFDGEVIKEIGDGLLIMFYSANRAVRFAMAAQKQLKDEDLTIRAGIHIGDVIFEAGDVFGSAVNIAARIEPLALAGGICISEDVRNQIRNQKDIIISSAGKKELKGVAETIEIYRVVADGNDQVSAQLPFLTDLWQRRVIQIAAIYLAVSLLIRMSMQFITMEYMLSPHLVNLVWYVLLSLLPSIILLSYFHGKRGVSKWTRVELVGMPLNLIAAILMIIFVFEGKDLGAMTTKVTVQDEDGMQIEKVLPKNEFRKKIFIFNLENLSGDTSLDYLQYSFPAMTEHDLSQDLLITAETSIKLYPKMLDAGYKKAIDLPLTLMKQYADERHMNYFLSGTFNKNEAEFILDVKVYDTKLTRLISEISLKDMSLFGLVDQLSVEIKRSMGLPESHINETPDLPVSGILTESESALYYFSLSIKAEALNQWEENVRYLNLATEADPGFAMAYAKIAISYLQIGDIENSRDALRSAMNYPYKLTEQYQFVVKYVDYVLDQKPDKAFKVVKMWTELYPDDLMAHATLAQRYAVMSMYMESINEYKEMLRIDPEQYEVLITLGNFYLELGNFDSSLLFYQQYKQEFPRQAKSYRKLGKYYSKIADMDHAQENLETALLMADVTEKVPVKVDLANILLKTGKFDLAYDQYLDALNVSRSARDSGSVFNAMEQFYLVKGQAAKSLELHELKLSKFRTFLSPKDMMVYQILNMDAYVNAGKPERAFAILEEIRGKMTPPLDKVVPLGYMFVYSETGDFENAAEAIASTEELIESFGEETLKAYVYLAKGKLNEFRGDYKLAIGNYNDFLAMNPTSYILKTYIARCYRLLKDYKKAEAEIQISLKYHPFSPQSNYEAALLYIERGDMEKGMEYLEKAVDIWKDADSDYDKASIAKEKLTSLQ